MSKFHLHLAAGLCAVSLAVTPALAADGDGTAADSTQTRKLDATRTGVDKVDENRVPDSIRDGLAELRRQSADQRDAAIETANKLMAELQSAADQAGAKLKAMGDEAAREWNEMSAAVQGNLEDAKARMEELQTAAAEKWEDTRTAVADALEKAAAALQQKKKG